jgi:hypothetical protein
MSEHHAQAGLLNEAEEILDTVLPSRDEAAEVMQPGEESFHLPASSVATQGASVLGVLFSPSPVGCDHFDVVFGGRFFIERVRVVGFVADEPCGKLVEEAGGQNVFHKFAS